MKNMIFTKKYWYAIDIKKSGNIKLNNFYIQDVTDEYGERYIVRKIINNYTDDIVFLYEDKDYYPAPLSIIRELYEIINTNNPIIKKIIRIKKMKRLNSLLIKKNNTIFTKNINMNREEGLKILHLGKKLSHTLFMSDEYIHIDKNTGIITTEDGFDFTEQWWEFEKFENGWSEFKMTNRMIAMEWWNNLSSLTKTSICDTTTDIVGSIRRYETLSGSEIEKLYKLNK